MYKEFKYHPRNNVNLLFIINKIVLTNITTTLPCNTVKPIFTFTYFAEYGTHTNNTCVVCLLD